MAEIHRGYGNYAKNDKNRTGPYCGVFGIAMTGGQRQMKRRKDGSLYSPNIEIWLSDFFWPFFTNYSYAEIMKYVLDVLIELEQEQTLRELTTQVPLPQEVLDVFMAHCREFGLTDNNGLFHDPYALVQFFCNPIRKPKRRV